MTIYIIQSLGTMKEQSVRSITESFAILVVAAQNIVVNIPLPRMIPGIKISYFGKRGAGIFGEGMEIESI